MFFLIMSPVTYFQEKNKKKNVPKKAHPIYSETKPENRMKFFDIPCCEGLPTNKILGALLIFFRKTRP